MGAPIKGMVLITAVQTGIALMTISPSLNQQFNTLVNLAVFTNVVPYILSLTALSAIMSMVQAGDHEGGTRLLLVDGLAAATELTKTLDDLTAYNFVLADDVVKVNHDSYILSMELSIALIIASFTISGVMPI